MWKETIFIPSSGNYMEQQNKICIPKRVSEGKMVMWKITERVVGKEMKTRPRAADTQVPYPGAPPPLLAVVVGPLTAKEGMSMFSVFPSPGDQEWGGQRSSVGHVCELMMTRT
jgi:hypothetical protein